MNQFITNSSFQVYENLSLTLYSFSNPCLNQMIHFQLEYSVYLLSIDQVSYPWIWGLKPQILLHQHNLFQYLKCSNFLACFVQHCLHLWSDFSMRMAHSSDSDSGSWVKLSQKSLQINLELRNCYLRKILVLKKVFKPKNH